MMKESREILQGLPRRNWWERQKDISRLVSYPAHEYIGCLEEGVRNHEDADIRNTAMEVYKALGEQGFPSLSTLLQDADHEVRLFAANILCDIGDRRTLPLLIRAMKDPDVNVRVAVAEALGRIGDEKALQVLEGALGDEPWVAMSAVQAIGSIGGDEARRILHSCLKPGGYQELALTCLGAIGCSESLQYLLPCFEQENLRELALRTVTKIALREKIRPQPEYFMHLIPVLLPMLDGPDPEMKRAAFLAFCWSRNAAGIPYMVRALRDEELQEYAVEGLLELGKRAVCPVIDELQGSSGPHRIILARMLSVLGEHEALLRFAGDEDPELRAEVALSLASVNLPRASQALEEMLEDPAEEVRMAAQRSLESRAAGQNNSGPR